MSTQNTNQAVIETVEVTLNDTKYYKYDGLWSSETGRPVSPALAKKLEAELVAPKAELGGDFAPATPDKGFELNFDPSKVEAFTVLPEGKYAVTIKDAKIDKNKAGTGTILTLTLRIAGEKFKNRQVFGRINVKNANQMAQSIGQTQLKAICEACGIEKLTSTTQLLGKQLMAGITIQTRKDNGQLANDVKYYTKAGQQAHPASFMDVQN
jgi:hypothetical protein